MKIKRILIFLLCCSVLFTAAYFTYRSTEQIKKVGTIEYVNKWNIKENVKYLVFGEVALGKLNSDYAKKEFNRLLTDCTIDAKFNCIYQESFEPECIDLYYNGDTLVVSYWYNCTDGFGLPSKELTQYKILNKKIIK